MSKVKTFTLVAIFFMMIPVINMLLDEGTEDFTPYSEVTVSLGDYLSTKDLGESNHSISWYTIPLTHTLDTSMVTSIDVKSGGSWYNDIESFGYPFYYNYASGSGNIELGHASSTELTILGNGTTSSFYWDMEHDETRINYVSYNEDVVEFYGRVFYNDWTLSYGDLDFEDTRTMGLEYDPDNNSAGYTPVELGILAIEDGLFGMLPRKNDFDEWEFPLIGHFLNSVGIMGGMLYDSLSNILDPPDIQMGGTNYWNIGNWEYDDTGFPEDIYWYTVSEGTLGFGGLRIKATVLTTSNAFYQRYTKLVFGIWMPQLFNRNISDSDMAQYQIDTSDFE